VLVALNTGMRKSEILRLEWLDVDFRRRIIYVLDAKTSDKDLDFLDSFAGVAEWVDAVDLKSTG